MKEPEVRNPRYAGATIGDFVRALVRPKKPKTGEPAKAERQPDSQESGIRFQRKK